MVTMKTIVDDLRSVVQQFTPKLQAINQHEFAAKPLPNKWSKQEVIGHLTDSAQNNLRRFIVGQYENRPKIVYQQDFWVASNNYQNARKDDVINHWRIINERICDILTAMPVSNHTKEVDTSKSTNEYHTLIWLAEDYVKHMKHHLNQVIPGSFNIKYP
jgi:hypothetical protein